jgi:hypothetical protein
MFLLYIIYIYHIFVYIACTWVFVIRIEDNFLSTINCRCMRNAYKAYTFLAVTHLSVIDKEKCFSIYLRVVYYVIVLLHSHYHAARTTHSEDFSNYPKLEHLLSQCSVLRGGVVCDKGDFGISLTTRQ